MSNGTLRVLRSGAGPPPANMALDEALLRTVDAPPTLRLYRWDPPGLSLGYFQRAADFDAVPGDHVLVRRITGGGAIYHHEEITFSLALPAARLTTAIPRSYDLIHDAIRRALAEIGVRVRRRGRDDRRAGGHPRPRQPWCFADPVPEDLLLPSGAKILGSAQRRIRRPAERMLHHGSLVLRAPAATPFCGSVEDCVGSASVDAQLEDAMVHHLAAALDLVPRLGQPTVAERRFADRLVADQYDCAAFTRRR